MGRSRTILPGDYVLERRRPSALTTAEIDAVVAILHQGGAVNPRSARQEMPQAKTVVLVRKDKAIVGVGAVKRPRPSYARQKQSDSGHSFDQDLCELGYVAVACGHRGHHLSSFIADALLARYYRDLFATTDKPEMKHVLKKRGFEQCGREWAGRGGELSLWLLERRAQNARR